MINPSLIRSPDLDSWISIDQDSRVHVKSGKVDIGQRISTALTILVGEELNIDPAQIIIDPPNTNYPDEGMTSGSNSMMHSGNALRAAAATARRHILVQGAKKLNVKASEVELNDGLISVPGSNQTITYREALNNQPFGILVDESIAFKAPQNYRWIGRDMAPRNLREMVTGTMKYLHDMTKPGMLHARCVRPPNYLSRLESLDINIVKRLEDDGFGVVQDGSFVAVTGEEEFQVIKAAQRLARTAKWIKQSIQDSDIFGQLKKNPRESLPVVKGTPVKKPVPPLEDPPPNAITTLSARYDKPYIMHGSIGPSAAMACAEVSGAISIWTHSQGIQPLRLSIADALNMSPNDIYLQHVPGAGCYGHNGADDAAFEAALIALFDPGRPVLLKWTREEEHAWEPYASAMSMELRGSLDKSGKVIDWSHESYSDTHLARPRSSANGGSPSRLLTTPYLEPPTPAFRPIPSMGNHAGLHRNIDPYYIFPKVRAVKHLVYELPLRTSALRCLGGYANVFAQESIVDELAAEIDIDPVEFRLRHLEDARASDVIRAAANRIDWFTCRDEGSGRGIAFSRYCNSKAYAAIAVELFVNDAAEISITKAVVAADAGEVVDKAGLRMQLEGGFLQAASWTLYEEVRFDANGITTCDWESYPIMTFAQVPDTDVIIVDRLGEPSLGAGEASSEPVAAAIANALFDATGIRARRLPFSPTNLRLAAMHLDS